MGMNSIQKKALKELIQLFDNLYDSRQNDIDLVKESDPRYKIFQDDIKLYMETSKRV